MTNWIKCSENLWAKEIAKILPPIFIPLRNGLIVKIVGLPCNISSQEGDKIINIIKHFPIQSPEEEHAVD